MVIYKITNLLNGKAYVGKTIQLLQNRWTRHLYDCKKNADYVLYRAMRKHGIDNFKIEQIDTAESWKELGKKEADWIVKLNSMCYQNGYNMKAEDNRLESSQETRNKQSRAMKGKKANRLISGEEKSKIAKENGSKGIKNTEGLKRFFLENPKYHRDINLKRMSDFKIRENLRNKAKEQFKTQEAREQMAISKGSIIKFRISLVGSDEILYEGYNQTECSRILGVSQASVRNWVLKIQKSRKYYINSNL